MDNTPTVLQLVVDDVLLSYINLHNFADFTDCIDAALNMGSVLGQMQEAARIDDPARVLELLPWLSASFDCMPTELQEEWAEVVAVVRLAAMGASLDRLPVWVRQKQSMVEKFGWQPIGTGLPYKKISVKKPPKLALVKS